MVRDLLIAEAFDGVKSALESSRHCDRGRGDLNGSPEL